MLIIIISTPSRTRENQLKYQIKLQKQNENIPEIMVN